MLLLELDRYSHIYILIVSVRLNSHRVLFVVVKFSIFHDNSMLMNLVRSQHVALLIISTLSVFFDIFINTISRVTANHIKRRPTTEMNLMTLVKKISLFQFLFLCDFFLNALILRYISHNIQ